MAAPRWWEGAVLYQVYVRSFRDSNGDGCGDLRGLIERLDHIADLGADALWLSPTMPSPDDDFGYDVSDYLGVHPQLGTLADLDALLAASALRGMKVMLDLVPNHTSSAHAWFVEAVSSRRSSHRDFYVFADPAADGGPPNNWRDSTGEAAWSFDEASEQYYLHNYLPSQPDLNWWNRAVHEAFDTIVAYWFDRGVAGFRIDVAHGLYKDLLLRDNPLPEPGAEQFAHGGLAARYSANRPETHAVLRRWRSIAEACSPPRLLLGETTVADLESMARYYGDDDELQLAFNFPFLYADFDAESLAAVVDATLASLPPGACPVWTGSNHDVSRFPTRWAGGDEAAARLGLLVLLTLPGTSVLYYGDELAMTDVEVPDEDQRDAMTARGRGGKFNRDRARTPMPWDSSPGAGFSDGPSEPWLPVGDRSRTVAEQRGRAGSTMELCRRLVELRHERLPGVPPFETLAAGGGLWSYRVGELLVHANFAGEDRIVADHGASVLVSTLRAADEVGAPSPGGPSPGGPAPGGSAPTSPATGRSRSHGQLLLAGREAVVLGRAVRPEPSGPSRPASGPLPGRAPSLGAGAAQE